MRYTVVVEPRQWAKAHFFVGCGNVAEYQARSISGEDRGNRATGSAARRAWKLVEVEVQGGGNSRFLRIAIDKPDGVTHADCEFVSQKVGTILDVEDVVPGALTRSRSALPEWNVS